MTPSGGKGRHRLLVVSGRRFVAESLIMALEGAVDDGIEGRTVIAGHRLAETAAELRPTIWFVDLDDPGLPLSILSREMQQRSGLRRAAFYDSFTAQRAEAAFELGVTVLVSLTSTIDHIALATFGSDRASTATAAEGLTRAQLRKLSSLTKREIEVLEQLVDGRPVRAASVALEITPHTVSSHKRRIFEKLGVQNGPAAVALAVKAGLVTEAEQP